MRFRDTDSWGIWISTLVVVPVCLWLIRRCCWRIADDPTSMLAMFMTILAVLLVSQLFIGASTWRLLDVQSRYEINETGIRSAKHASKVWSQVPWTELTCCGVYKRWGLKRYAYFSNYDFDGKEIQGPVNDAGVKKILFLIPLTRRGRRAIEQYAPGKVALLEKR